MVSCWSSMRLPACINVWIFTKLGVCIDIGEIWIGIANGQISSIFDRVICTQRDNGRVLSFHVFIMYLKCSVL